MQHTAKEESKLHKLLFDQNLPHGLISKLADIFPDSNHTKFLSFSSTPDIQIWSYAKENGFHIITKDEDFEELSLRLSFPPKVILVRKGNCPTSILEALLREKYITIRNFLDHSEYGCLILK